MTRSAPRTGPLNRLLRNRSQAPPISPAQPLRPSRRMSGACLVLSSFFFVAGWTMASIAAPDFFAFFYQPRVLAVTHTFTLGWISLAMTGVLYQYVPALTKRPLLSARLVGVQVTLFVLGVLGMIAHFWIGRYEGMTWAAGGVLLSVLLLAAQLLPALVHAPQYDTTVIGILGAILSFLLTASLGLLFAIDKVYPFLGGSVLSNIAAHAHIGLLGWVSLTICTVSYRLIAAFALPRRLFPRAMRLQITALLALVPLLFVALLLRSASIGILGVLVAAALMWYAALLLQLVRTRRMPLDWSLRHALAGLGHLAAAVGVGLVLVFAVEPTSALGSRLVIAYACLFLGGWVSNYIMGVGTRMAPGLMGQAASPVLSERSRAAVFWSLNCGVVAVAASVLWGDTTAFRAAALLPLTAGLFFSATLVRQYRSGAEMMRGTARRAG